MTPRYTTAGALTSLWDETTAGAKSLAEATASEAGTLVADFFTPIAVPVLIGLGLVALIVLKK